MAQRSELPGRVYVTDSGIRSQVGWMVSPAAIPQGVQFRRLHSVRPVASAWLMGIHAMKTALSSNAIGPVTISIDSDQTLEDKVRPGDSCCLSASELEAGWSAGNSGEAGCEAHHVVLQDQTTRDCDAFGQLGKLNYELRQKEVRRTLRRLQSERKRSRHRDTARWSGTLAPN